MNKGELVARLAKQKKITKTKSEKVVNAVISIIQDALTHGDDIRIAGVGRWYVTKRKERQSRNPQTGEMLRVAPQKMPTFKPSRTLKGLFR